MGYDDFGDREATRENTKGGNPVTTKVRLPIDPGMAMIAAHYGLPYDVVVEAADAEAVAQNHKTWRIAEATVRTAVLAMRKHRSVCGLPDCSGPEWESLVGSLEWEHLAVVFAAASQMLMEYLPEYDKAILQAEAEGMRPDVGRSEAEHVERVTARVVERARAILAARQAGELVGVNRQGLGRVMATHPDGLWVVTPNLPQAEPEFQQLADHAFHRACELARRFEEAVIDAPDGSSYVLRWLNK